MEIEFKIKYESENLSRIGILTIKRNGRVIRIETPVLWLTSTINGRPQIWKELKEIKHIMLSCYDLMKNKKRYVRDLLTKNYTPSLDLHEMLSFKGAIFLDSGGFQFLRGRNLNVTPQTVFDIQKNSGADLATILDYPFSFNDSYSEKMKMIRWTIESLITYVKLMKNQETDLLILPVIHGHDPVSLIRMAKKVKQIYDNGVLCVGSLVPVLFPVKYTGIKSVAKAFLEVRKMFPETFIHVLGAGSSLSLHLFFYLGADSVDSSTWITKAGYGNIHLPGHGAAYIRRDGRRKKCRFIDWERYECKCPICRNRSPDEVLKEMDRHDSHGRRLRAIHNAWVYLKEVELAKKSIIAGDYEKIVRERMHNAFMKKPLESIIQTVKLHKFI